MERWWECLRCGDHFRSVNPGALQVCSYCERLRLKGQAMVLVLVRPGERD